MQQNYPGSVGREGNKAVPALKQVKIPAVSSKEKRKLKNRGRINSNDAIPIVPQPIQISDFSNSSNWQKEHLSKKSIISEEESVNEEPVPPKIK